MSPKPPARLTLDKVVARVLQLPLRRPIVAKLGECKNFPFILTDVLTKEGVIGHSYLEPYRVSATKSIVALIEDMAQQQRGKPVAPFDRFEEAVRSLHLLGRQGVMLIAIAALDMAMWDALAKAMGLPLVVALGGTVGPVRAYNTNGLWLIPIERIADEASALVAEANFKALKIRLGRDNVKEDLKAIAEVRRAVGDDILLMSDFNQGLSFNGALRRLHQLDDQGLEWFEEPIVFDDFAGCARLANDRPNKNDAVDAEAICEAVGRPNMRFVALREVENQAELMRHRTRELLAGNRTRMLNALRGHLAEIGVVAPHGAQHAYGVKRLLTAGHDENGEIVVPDCVREALAPLAGQIDAIDDEIQAIDDRIKAQVKGDDLARRLATIPSIGPITASAIVATVRDPSAFASGREFSAFIGLTPGQNSSGGKERLGSITKMGDRYLRKLLVVGARAALVHRKGHNDALRVWADQLMARKPAKYKFKLTAVAFANKVPRIVFALMTHGGEYVERPVVA